MRYLVEEYDPSDVYCLWIEKRTSGANKRSADDAQLPAAEPRSAPSLSRRSTEVATQEGGPWLRGPGGRFECVH